MKYNHLYKKNLPLLSSEEEVELAKKKDAGDKQARDKLIQSNLRLVQSIVNDYRGSICDREDLVSEGNIGLMKGIDKFDWKRGFRISTYVTWWIRLSISRFIADHEKSVRIPIHLQDINKKVQRVIKEYVKEFNEEPTVEEIGSILEMDVNVIEKTLKYAQNHIISLTTSSQNDNPNDNKINLLDKISASSSVENQLLQSTIVEYKEVQNIIKNVIENLPKVEANIFNLRFEINKEPKN